MVQRLTEKDLTKRLKQMQTYFNRGYYPRLLNTIYEKTI